MRPILIAVCAAFVFGISFTAFAQPLPQRCDSKQKEIEGMEQSASALDKEIADLGARSEALKAQLADLEKTAADKKQQKSDLEAQAKREKSAKETMCKPLATCAEYEAKLTELKSAITPILDSLKALRKDAQLQKDSTRKMKDRIGAIQKDYPPLKCDMLVEGETPKATIDRCNALFNEWKTIESDVAKIIDKLRSLREQFKGHEKNAKPRGKALTGLHANMRKTCDFSLRLAEIDGLVADHKDIATIAKILDDSDSDGKAVKAVALTEPKITKKPAPQPPAQQAQAQQPPSAKPGEKTATKEDKEKGKTVAAGAGQKAGGLDIDIKGNVKGGVDVSKKGVKGNLEAEGQVDVNKKKVAGGKVKTDTDKLLKK